MATVKLKFRPSSAQGREGTLFYQVIHRRVVRCVCTGYYIFPEEWDEAFSMIRVGGSDVRQSQLRLMRDKVEWEIHRMTAIITRMESARSDYTTDQLLAAFRQLPPVCSLFCFIQEQITRKTDLGRMGTAKTYADALRSFSLFRKGEDLAVSSLTREMVDGYEAWLKARGLKRNSTSCYLRTLRTLYRKAVEMGLADDGNIFRHVFTGFAKTAKRAISIPYIKAIVRLEIPAGSSLAFARDLFLFSFYMRGMAFVDIAYLKKSDLKNGIVVYNRRKTQQTLAIEWEKPMQDIVDRYARLTVNSPYMLPVITRFDGTERRQYEMMEQKTNRLLKNIAQMVGLHVPLTTYVARHTWASVARDSGCSLSVISEGMGHDSLKTTQVYLSSINRTEVDKANRKIINLIRK